MGAVSGMTTLDRLLSLPAFASCCCLLHNVLPLITEVVKCRTIVFNQCTSLYFYGKGHIDRVRNFAGSIGLSSRDVMVNEKDLGA